MPLCSLLTSSLLIAIMRIWGHSWGAWSCCDLSHAVPRPSPKGALESGDSLLLEADSVGAVSGPDMTLSNDTSQEMELQKQHWCRGQEG